MSTNNDSQPVSASDNASQAINSIDSTIDHRKIVEATFADFCKHAWPKGISSNQYECLRYCFFSACNFSFYLMNDIAVNLPEDKANLCLGDIENELKDFRISIGLKE